MQESNGYGVTWCYVMLPGDDAANRGGVEEGHGSIEDATQQLIVQVRGGPQRDLQHVKEC
jgi:hypothetical protein